MAASSSRHGGSLPYGPCPPIGARLCACESAAMGAKSAKSERDRSRLRCTRGCRRLTPAHAATKRASCARDLSGPSRPGWTGPGRVGRVMPRAGPVRKTAGAVVGWCRRGAGAAVVYGPGAPRCSSGVADCSPFRAGPIIGTVSGKTSILTLQRNWTGYRHRWRAYVDG